MADTESSVSSLPWIWVIEALASDQQVNMSILNDLASRASIPANDWGNNAREKAALRCLEDLFNQSHGSSVLPPTSDSRIGFDLSKSCEHVLQHVLTAVSSNDVGTTGPELLKWDLRPFIMHKKASLSKCALEMLKDTIIKGTHPLAPYLLDKSGLAAKVQFNGRDSVEDDDSNPILPKFDAGNTDHQIEEEVELMTTFISENGNRKVRGDSPHKTNLFSKREKSTSTGENLVGQILVNIMKRDRDLHPDNKKHKPGPSAGQDFVPGNDLLENPCGETIAHTETALHNSAEELGGGLERVRNSEIANELLEIPCGGTTAHTETALCNLAEELGGGLERVRNSEIPNDLLENPCGRRTTSHTETVLCNSAEEVGVGLEQVRSPENANDLLRRIEQNNGTDTVVRNKEFHSCDNEMPQDVCKGPSNNASANIACEPIFSKSTTTSGTKRKICFDEADEDSEEDTSSDTDRYHVEEIEVTVTKNKFLNSQLTFSEDTHVWTEQNLCMKCNKDGKLLHCCASACPFVVHENCLGSSAIFDNEGKFYCPFCTYSRAITTYLKIKKKASRARKQLSAFLISGCQKDNFYLSFLHKENKKKPRNNKSRENTHRVGGTHGEKISIEEDVIQANNGYHINDHHTEKYVDNENQTEKYVDNENQTNNQMVKESEIVREIAQEKQLSADSKCDSDTSSSREAETVVVSWKHAEEETKQSFSQQIIDPQEHPCKSISDVDETSGAVNDKLVVSSYSMRFRSPQQSSPSYPKVRKSRKTKCPWTAEEEEILKEGVKRFGNDSDMNIQWNNIFEFGCEIYQRNGRTLTNLQDKWRYMCKRSHFKK